MKTASNRLNGVADPEGATPAYITTTVKEARLIYNADLATHVTPQMRSECLAIMELLQSEHAYDVFVPTHGRESTWLHVILM